MSFRKADKSPAVAPVVEKIEEMPPRRPRRGDTVEYTKSVSTQTGNAIETYPAMVTGFPRDSNFQDKDMAVDLVIFGQRGVVVDQKYGVMFSPKLAQGRWSYRE